MKRDVRRLVHVLAGLVFLAALAVLLIDYVRFRRDDARLAAVLAELDITSGSIGGWPFGREHVLCLHRPLDDDEIRQLARAISACHRRAFRIHFRDFEVPKTHLERLRRELVGDNVWIQGASPDRKSHANSKR